MFVLMPFIMFLVVIIAEPAKAHSLTYCNKQLPVAAQTTEAELTEVLMECNILFLNGQTKFLKPKSLLTSNRRSESIIQYSKCEEFARIVKDFMRACKDYK